MRSNPYASSARGDCAAAAAMLCGGRADIRQIVDHAAELAAIAAAA